eukprot:308553-Amphidinium_carterae.1
MNQYAQIGDPRDHLPPPKYPKTIRNKAKQMNKIRQFLIPGCSSLVLVLFVVGTPDAFRCCVCCRIHAGQQQSGQWDSALAQ